ncbi:MAG: hypothetical protein NVSMB4_01560 [Acidimicrobiales bacterium]
MTPHDKKPASGATETGETQPLGETVSNTKSTPSLPVWVTIDGRAHRVTELIEVPRPHYLPRYETHHRPRVVVETVPTATGTADYWVVYRDELSVGYAPKAQPRRIPPAPRPPGWDGVALTFGALLIAGTAVMVTGIATVAGWVL